VVFAIASAGMGKGGICCGCEKPVIPLAVRNPFRTCDLIFTELNLQNLFTELSMALNMYNTSEKV
jgi:hypothetical protein